MPHPFRFEPPGPRPGSVTRPRLLRTLLGRWERRVTSVIGGPGLGKTTLLAQSLAENRLAPRGADVWLGVEAGDADGDGLARDLSTALDGHGGRGGPAGDGAVDAALVADAVWRRAPDQVCLHLDNVHLIPESSPGAAWLAELIEALPANGHVLLSSRRPLPVAVVRLAASGDLLRIDEADLRFSDEELAGFARRRGVDTARLAGTGGWPAMAELAASVDGDLAGDYLWEEVLRPLGPKRRRVLAVVCDLGGADDDLASAALGCHVDVAGALAGVPLIAVGSDGWCEPHQLWQTSRALRLTPDERTATRRRAVAHLTERHRFDDAMAVAHDAGLHDLVPGVLRAACVAGARPSAARLTRWLSLSTPAVRSSAAGQLAAALRLTLVSPGEAAEPLQRAAACFRVAGDVEGELVAIANLGRLAWWHQQIRPLVEAGPRVAELEKTGHPFAMAMAACGRAVFADLSDDDQRVLDELATVAPGSLDAAWDAMAAWMRANVIAGMGDTEAAAAEVARFPPSSDPNFALTVEGLAVIVAWMAGRIDEVFERLPPMLGRLRAIGMAHNLSVALAGSARLYAHVGDAETGRHQLEEAGALACGDMPSPARLAAAAAAIHLTEGDEDRAGDVMARGLRARRYDKGVDRRVWRHTLPLSYVLVPETRQRWEEAELHGFVAQSRTLARAVVAARGGDDDRYLRELELPVTDLVRTILHHRFAAELAVGLEAVRHPGAPALLEAIGPVGRSVVRELGATATTRRARSAKVLLAAVPAPPATVTEVATLGPLSIRRDGRPVDDPVLRRERLRALLAFLVTQRETFRSTIMAALWPDLDERSAANNLRVTLTYLLRLLEPWRAAGESAFHVRTNGQRVELVTGDWLRIDVDAFDERIAAAARAEADGTPSLALEHNLAAVDLYRGDLHTGVPEADWNRLERDHYRSRFVNAATRAAQLLAARGDPEQAEVVARRAIASDPWAEDAYALLVATALDRGDRSAARRALDRCLEALADLGVEPSDETQRLRRRVRSAGR